VEDEMSDGFWYRAWQFALLFAAIALLAASVVVQNGNVSRAEVEDMITAAGVTAGSGNASAGGTAAPAYPVDASITPELTPLAQLQPAPAGEVHATYVPNVPPPSPGRISASRRSISRSSRGSVTSTRPTASKPRCGGTGSPVTRTCSAAPPVRSSGDA
jgi:hypothetical protein